MSSRLAGISACLLLLSAGSAEGHHGIASLGVAGPEGPTGAKVSLAFGVKVPTWTDLNEEDDQQGGEGTEHYRLVGTLSILF